MKLKCSLSGFLRSIVMMPAGAVHPTSETSSTWPMPIPFPEAFASGSHLLADCSTKRLISLQVVVFDWLVLGRPSIAPSCLKLGRRLTSRQWSVVRTLEHLSFDGNTPKFVDAGTMGRAAVKVEGYEESLGVLARALSTVQSFDGAYSCPSSRFWSASGEDDFLGKCGTFHSVVEEPASGGSKPLVAERLQFPGRPSFDPRPFFDKSTSKLYDFPLDLGRPLDEVGDPPTVQVRVSRPNKLKLFKMMADVDLLKPIPDGTFLKKYRNGLFAVPKDSSRDRMVLDGRPANMVDRGQQRWSQAMASGAALAGIYIEDDKDLV